MANLPHPQHPDLEDLVAFLEGRGSEAVRALVLKRLDEDPDYLATMNDLLPMLREAGLIPEGGIAPASPEPTTSEPKTNVIGDASRFRRRTGLIAIAAALMLMGVGLWLWTDQIPTATRLAKMLSEQSAALDSEVWQRGVNRSGTTDSTSKSITASDLPLIGAQILDLEVAVRNRDLASARTKVAALISSLGDKADVTYGKVQGQLGAVSLVWDEIDAEMKEADRYLKLAFSDDDLKLVDKGTCLRAAFLAQQAGKPDFTNSWPDACLDALKDQDLNEEIKRMQELFGSLPDDFETNEDSAAQAPPG